MGSWEHVAFLAGSANRVRILDTLRERPRRQCELVDACGLSRSTVHRALDGLEERGWVHSEGGAYRLTVGGRLVFEQYEALETAIERVDEWGSFLQRLGEVGATLPVATLDDARLITNTPANPHAAMHHITDVFVASDTGTFRGITPVVSPVINEAAHELLTTGAAMGLVIDESVLDTSRTAYPDAFAAAHDFENFELYLSPEGISFGLLVLDDRALVSTYDEQGTLHGCLDSTNEALVGWANDVYEDRWAAAERIDTVPEATPRR
ncbi:helix-turn-helix transcriptional regulator [Halococcus sediminicola]|uniref:helix-turn-helix transcriptional regulator n=1 Tax=Halococcus sediminicola TaxID=1264579 RepID=UPI0006788908|nr:helix-turn-helix domain-containing protein [Halococcus sediminicola]